MKAHKDDLKELSQFPRSWTDPVTGTTYPRKFLEDLPDGTLNEMGWFTVQVTTPLHDPETERIVKGSLVFTGSQITRTDTKEPIPQEELDAIATAEADAKLRQIDLDSIADIRAWILTQSNPPANLATLQGLAAAERAKRRP